MRSYAEGRHEDLNQILVRGGVEVPRFVGKRGRADRAKELPRRNPTTILTELHGNRHRRDGEDTTMTTYHSKGNDETIPHTQTRPRVK